MSELTTEEVKGWYAGAVDEYRCDTGLSLEEGEALFDTWLAQVQREAKVQALREAAQDSQMGPVSYGWSASGIAGWLRARAEQIEGGAGE